MIENQLGFHSPTIENRVGISEDQIKYLTELKGVIDLLNNSELNGKWWMVGGIAKDAYTKNVDFRVGDVNHRRDLDILVRGGSIREFEKVRKQNKEGIPLGGFLNRLTYISDEKAFLFFGDVKVDIPTKIFSPKEVDLFGVKFQTLPPETLFHLYCLRGEMRSKDFLSALQIGRYIQKNPTPDLNEELYRGFHEFSKKVQLPSTHPHATMVKLSKWYGNTKFGQMFPLTNPVIRSIVLHIWDSSGLSDK